MWVGVRGEGEGEGFLAIISIQSTALVTFFFGIKSVEEK